MPGGSTVGGKMFPGGSFGRIELSAMKRLEDDILQNEMKHRDQLLMLTHVADEAAYLLRLFLEDESCAWEMAMKFLRQYPTMREAYGSPDVK